MLDHGRSRQLGGALPTLLVALIAGVRPAQAQQPTALTFVVPHAVCHRDGNASALDFYVNEHHVASEPTQTACACATPEESTFTFTAPEILALIDLASCNTFRVDGVLGAASVQVADVLVRVTSAAGSAEACLFDGLRVDASPRCGDIACKPAYVGPLSSCGEPDPDSDGLPSGIGVGTFTGNAPCADRMARPGPRSWSSRGRASSIRDRATSHGDRT